MFVQNYQINARLTEFTEKRERIRIENEYQAQGKRQKRDVERVERIRESKNKR